MARKRKGKTIQDLIRDTLETIRVSSMKQMQTYGRNATKASTKSLNIVFTGDTTAQLVGSQSFLWMERGARKSKYATRPSLTHIEAIEKWIKAKGITVKPIPYKKKGGGKYTPKERGLRTMAGAIATSILMHGTKLHRTKGFDEIFVRQTINQAFSELAGKVVWVADVDIEKTFERFPFVKK